MLSESSDHCPEHPEALEQIRAGLIGDKQLIETCFGPKPMVYADYTASGRALDFVEDFIRERVLPFYANTHTETSLSGAQTTALREQAREVIRTAVGANDEYAVIFCGSGATAAINKLLDMLNLRLPADLAARHQLLSMIPQSERPLVILGPYEHHSNELPWRESIADVEVVPLNCEGQVDMEALQDCLERHRQRGLIIGSFSAASNVTGIRSDVDAITNLLHEYGALSFWDYAAAAPYVSISMAGAADRASTNKDAAFISPHKFVGGPGSPGVLVVRKSLLNNRVPATPGGGTVTYVTPEDHRYNSNPECREEGGTPAIVESIRAGLAFEVQRRVGVELIERREHELVNRALKRWSQNPCIELLGNTDAERISIVSLRVKHGEFDLHYSYVVALLNDLFGIQARGGCSCAGPYGHALLGMDMAYSRALEAQIVKGNMVMRPGWARLNFNYFIDEEEFEYLLRAFELIADHGWRLLPFYHWDAAASRWRYLGREVELPVALSDFSMASPDHGHSWPRCNTPLDHYLELAEAELCRDRDVELAEELLLPAQCESLRWFALPQEITKALTAEQSINSVVAEQRTA